jgi:hypothetical protein
VADLEEGVMDMDAVMDMEKVHSLAQVPIMYMEYLDILGTIGITHIMTIIF